jgi:RimJ/RimL family protein N-acetyltransferase
LILPGKQAARRNLIHTADRTLNITFSKLTQPTIEIAACFERWENDPDLIPFMRPNHNQQDLEKREIVTIASLTKRIENHEIHLIYLDDQLVGEVNYTIDPAHLLKKEAGTAWIGVDIGEADARGKGIGHSAMQYLEEQIRFAGYKRIELGVFEFNLNAIKLYQKSGYAEIGRINDFTFWQGKMWQDIRMEKYI